MKIESKAYWRGFRDGVDRIAASEIANLGPAIKRLRDLVDRKTEEAEPELLLGQEDTLTAVTGLRYAAHQERTFMETLGVNEPDGVRDAAFRRADRYEALAASLEES